MALVLLLALIVGADAHVSAMTPIAASRLLGVQLGASRDAVRKAYRLAAARCHPDVSSEPDAVQAFQRVAAAYDELLRHAHVVTRPPSPQRSSAAEAQAAAARAWWAAFWEAEVTLKRLEASLARQRLSLGQLRERRELILDLLGKHTGAAER